MPITVFLSFTHVFNKFESLSPLQRQHEKTYVTGLVAASNNTVTGITREALPANSNRALNTFHRWDEQQFNHQRLDTLDDDIASRYDYLSQIAKTEFPTVDRLT